MFRFLELAEVEEMHLDSPAAYGGATGTRDALYEAMIAIAIAIAKHELDKPGLAVLFRKLFS